MRAVSVNGNPTARAAATAAATRSVATPMSKSGLSLLPVASSMEPPTRPTEAPSRMVSAASAGASAKHFSRSALTGRSVASAMARQCASASSRVTLPSRRPSVPASAPLEVASAWKPSAARMRAEPASHGFGITNAPGASWRARKRAAFSLWLTVMMGLLGPPIF